MWREWCILEVRSLTETVLRAWVADLHTARSTLTGAVRSVNTIAAYTRSVRAFCNWLVQQGTLPHTPFPPEAVPDAQRRPPQVVAPEVFAHLLDACQPTDAHGRQSASMTARNRAILWLLLDTGLLVSELCGLRLGDVDRAGGTVTVRRKQGQTRTLPLSADGQQAVCAYLDQARFTPAWEPAVPGAQDRLLLTELRHPLTKNSLTLLFLRLNQRAGLTSKPVCPSMLRDTSAIRFLQAGGTLQALQERLGLADLVSVKRYQRFSDQMLAQQQGKEHPENQASKPHMQRQRGKGICADRHARAEGRRRR